MLPQVTNYKKILKYRSKLYLRYVYNFNNWLHNEFYLTNNYKFKYNFHAFVIILKDNNREKFLKYLKKIILSKGDLVETSKNERHAIRAIKDSEFLVFTQGPRGGKEYEKDTFRLLKSLIK